MDGDVTYDDNPDTIPEYDPSKDDLHAEEVDLATFDIEQFEPEQQLRPLVAATTVSSAVGQRMVEIALSQVGVRESGVPNGGVPFERYQRPFGYTSPVPWCACFVSWNYWQTTLKLPPWKNRAYVGSVYDWARAGGHLTSSPQRGDMFGIRDEHMGLVAARMRNGIVLTVEGNWSDRVLSQQRAMSGLWFATPTL
jgi:hypothetical protein